MRAILFDLDGTLLDIDLTGFLRSYFEALGRATAERYPGTDVLGAILASTEVMQHDHAGRTNRETFNADFLSRTGVDLDDPENAEVFDAFYRDTFPSLGHGFGPAKGGRRAIETARAHGMRIVIATQPIFPRAAIEHRLAWAGLSDLELGPLTTYEVMHACKPSAAYFREAAAMVDCEPTECLMVGDDRALDMPAADIGMRTFYTGTDGAAADWRGDLDELADLIGRLAVGGADRPGAV
ncbi:MAG TPA: HAD family hydrolase [Coriobacteriia bacterium]